MKDNPNMLYRCAARYPIQVIVTVFILAAFSYVSFFDTITRQELPALARTLEQWNLFDRLPKNKGEPAPYLVAESSFDSETGAQNWELVFETDNENQVDYGLIEVFRPAGQETTFSMGFLETHVNASAESFTSGRDSYVKLGTSNMSLLNTVMPIKSAQKVVEETPSISDLLLQRLLPAIQKHTFSLTWTLRFLGNAWMHVFKLASHASTTELVLVGTAYVCMIVSIISLLTNMRRLGSRIWLSVSALLCVMIAIQLAISCQQVIGGHVDFYSVVEAVPFIVNAIGFEKPLSLARAVIPECSIKSTNPLHEEVAKACSRATKPLLRHFGVSMLVLGVFSYVNFGVNQFAFFTTVLVIEMLLNVTFFVSFLTLKLELRRFKVSSNLHKALVEEGFSESTATSVVRSSEQQTKSNVEKGFSIKRCIASIRTVLLIGFVGINLFKLCSVSFPSYKNLSNSNQCMPLSTYNLDVTVNFFKQNAFQSVLAKLPAQVHEHATRVRFLPPIICQAPPPATKSESYSVLKDIYRLFTGTVLPKWFMIGFAFSIAANVYLLNVARVYIQKSNNSNKPAKTKEKIVEVVKRIHVSTPSAAPPVTDPKDVVVRPLTECVELYKGGKVSELNDEEIVSLVLAKKIPLYALEKVLKDLERAVYIRRIAVSRTSSTKTLETSAIPVYNFDYARVLNACCENVIGYMPLPLGVAGPLIIDGKSYYIPLATTEGALVASAMRGCKAINAGGGATTILTRDEMARGPCITFPTLSRAGFAKMWLDSPEGQEVVKNAFNSTSRFARLQHLKTALAGTRLYVRFCTSTGDAMGMNMISKGVEHALAVMCNEAGFEDMKVVSVSGNYCTDKKPAAINWIEGRGKSVVAEAIVPAKAVESILKTTVDDLVQLNINKNLIGSAMAGCVGGFNAHAANLVTAIFLATGQDPAQNVESSNCITLMDNVNGNLRISVSMPSIEVGTIGGGTVLEPQAAMLDLLGVRGPHPTNPGSNARQLARIVAAGVMAGELSLCSALASGHLVKSHIGLNRSALNTPVAGTSANKQPPVDLLSAINRARQPAKN
ncbi:3-hydroxy-3-methylglutaryl-CoA reductase Hmg1 [Schizosaccharomyces japonicus yFS275]|uniref:3-hydroxy-3-methylglutaryl coenzyme A reductase n=1 Tax=Schizosaccharomyces japonicus (strain yFS275 / FY16936) TaxID=402676 RepID=B6K500_SCHJY|nr:3-hydroxy-3-methylglutaryl-CoA reductase Hmg1 [Schizosaccharomyces japonicus yFS275]EEB08557.2 3-hydroxy-3-methylglutaryl-CoA reductase Hmg1 [Schizosaccharomyces japonicus yFS275]